MSGKSHGFRSIGMAVAGVLWGAAPLAAQAIEGPQTNTVFMTQTVACGPPDAGGPALAIAAEPRAEAVKDAPYSAVGTTEIVTTLADGNRIVRTNTMKYYRDKAGRTRTEYSLTAIGPFTPDQAQSVVMITDPVEGHRYILHSALKRADVFPLSDPGPGKMAVMTASKGGGVVGYVSKPALGIAASTGTRANPPTASGTPKAGATLAPARGAGPAPARPPVVVMSMAAALPPANAGFIMQYAPPMPGPDSCRPSAKPLPAPTSLGERIIEGLKVTGTRTEFTIAAGAVGNEQPIVISSEQWFSPDLGVVVSSMHRDPMMGDTSYKLEQISRTEPDPSLFAVPADYTQNDVTADGGVFFENGAPPPGAPPMGATVSGSLRLQAAPTKPADK